MEKRTGFFRDHEGKKSSTRLQSFMLVCAGISIILAGIVVYIRNPEDATWTAITAAASSIIVLGLGSKIYNKSQENEKRNGTGVS